MTARTNEPGMLSNAKIPVQAKLAAAWTSLMFLIIYIDYFHLFQPGEIDEIRGGVIFAFDISGTLMSVFFIVILIPTLMVMLSIALPARANRVTNLIIGSLYIPVVAINFVGAPSGFALYYALTIGVEVLILAYILRSAWTWPRTGLVPAGSQPTDLRQDLHG